MRVEGSLNWIVLIVCCAAFVFFVAVVAAGWAHGVPLHHKQAYPLWVDYGRR